MNDLTCVSTSHSSNDDVETKDAQLTSLLRQTEEALEEVDVSLRREYDAAKELIPRIVATETSFIKFLHTENFDPKKAAKRLALYWTYRKDLFGERWLLPMKQTGSGTMDSRDIAFLRTGCFFFQPLPDGNVLILVDYSRAGLLIEQGLRNGWDTGRIFERVAFYLCTNCTTKKSKTVGATLLHPLTSAERPVMQFRVDLWEQVRTALPIKITRAVVAQAYEVEEKRALLDFFRVQVSKVVQFDARLLPLEVHGDSVNQTAQLLIYRGLPRKYLPLPFGGALDYDREVAEWARARISVEDLLAAPVAVTPLVPPEVIVNAAGAKRKANFSIKRKDGIVEEDFCRKRNALYSRRTYHKRKLEALSLTEEVKVLEGHNKYLRVENSRLERLLAQAQQILCGNDCGSYGTSSSGIGDFSVDLMLKPAPGSLASQRLSQGDPFTPNASIEQAPLTQSGTSLSHHATTYPLPDQISQVTEYSACPDQRPKQSRENGDGPLNKGWESLGLEFNRNDQSRQYFPDFGFK